MIAAQRTVLPARAGSPRDVEAVRDCRSPPDLSLTAMIFMPCCSISCAAIEPTLPKPWTATLVPCDRHA